MGKPEDSIVTPPAFKGFRHKTVLYIPADTHTRPIEKAVQDVAQKDLKLPMGHLYGLSEAVVLYGCIGAPAAVMALESLIAGGAEEVIQLGFCGSLCHRARLLDALVVTEALSDEGTSSHYFPERKEFVPSAQLTESLEQTLRTQGLPLLPGSVVSTDAPYRETPSWRDSWLDSGMDGVDMETSAVFALAEFRVVRAAALLIVSDELRDLGHNRGFNHPRMPEVLAEYFMPFIRERA